MSRDAHCKEKGTQGN